MGPSAHERRAWTRVRYPEELEAYVRMEYGDGDPAWCLVLVHPEGERGRESGWKNGRCPGDAGIRGRIRLGGAAEGAR